MNAHGHAPMVLFRGIADDLRLMQWLQEFIFPAEKNNVTAAFVKAGTELAALEMIRSGTTTFVDMYYFEDQVAEACDAAGLRCVLGSTLIEFPAPDNKTIPDALAYAERFLKRWAGHAARDRGGGAAFHLPRDAGDAEGRARPRRPVRRADPHPSLGKRGRAEDGARAVWQDADRAPPRPRASCARACSAPTASGSPTAIAGSCATRRSGIAHCPQSNMKLASGTAPVRQMLAEGLRLGLGTDGAASNNDLDMFEEMATAAFLAKHAAGDPTVAPASKVLEMATLGGARALGMEDRIGSLEAGKRADIVVVDVRAPRMTPMYDPVSHLVYVAKGADVRHVVVEGRVVMRDRAVLTLDERAVVARAAALAARVTASLKGR